MSLAGAFLRQARSDFTVFELLESLQRSRDVPQYCVLHYLQMATEKLAKAAHLRSDPDFSIYTHVVLSKLPRLLLGYPNAAHKLGYRDSRHFGAFLRNAQSLFDEIEKLSPQVADRRGGRPPLNNPNVEYPWFGRQTDGAEDWIAPRDHDFPELQRLQVSYYGIQIPLFIRRLLNAFDTIF